MDLKEQLLNRALRLAQDPRVLKAMQDPRVVQGILGAIQLRAKLEQQLEAGARVMAKRLNLATGAELRELRRTLGRLERELAEARQAGKPTTGAGDNGHPD